MKKGLLGTTAIVGVSGLIVGVAGAAGMDLLKTHPLAKVKTEAEAMDLTVAFIQLYREHARYMDRPYTWVAKVGMDWIIERVVDDETERVALCERFEISQTVYRNDPWAKEATPEYVQQKWSPLADLTLEAAE